MEAQMVQFLWDTFISDGILVIAAVFVMGQMVKKLPVLDKIPNKYISLIGIILGAIIAVLCPDVYPGEDMTTSAIKGGSLGLMTTGMYEVLKIFFPRLSAKLSEKTADVDSTLSEILDDLKESGTEDVVHAKEEPKSLDQLIDEVVNTLDQDQIEKLVSVVTNKNSKKELPDQPSEV